MTQDAVPDFGGFGTEAEPAPIGVPRGYSTEEPIRAGLGNLGRAFQRRAMGQDTYARPPKYVDGNQYDPANLPTDDIIALQEKMVAAGLMEKGDYIVGVWDAASTAAYEKLLGEANASGDDERVALDRRIASFKANPPPQQKRAPNVIQLTHPEDIRDALHQTAMRLYGGDLDEAQTQAFISSYQSMQSQADTAAYNLGDPDGPGGTVVAPPDVGVLAEKAIREAHPEQVFASALGSKFKDMVGIFNNPGGF
jgi:hypothetical protein